MRTLAALVAAAALAAGEPVTIFMYSEYIDPSLEAAFEAKTGYDLRIEVYEAQEDMIAKLRTGGSDQYDVVVASDTVVQQMVALQLVQPLDPAKLPNRANVDPRWLKPPYDPADAYTLPYFWGTTGIIWDARKVQGDCSWAWVLDPAGMPGPVVLLDEARSMIGAALVAQGQDINSVDPEQLRLVKDRLVAAKKGAKCLGFDGGTAGVKKVLAGEAVAAVVFNGDAAKAIGENRDLRYAVPAEGGNIWVDAMLLSAKAPNPKGAYALIDFLLDAQVAAQNANYLHYATPVAAAKPHIAKEDLANSAVYPPAEVMQRLHYLHDLGKGSRLWDAAWTAVKSE